MRAIKISEAVWNEIAKRGEFGETEDDVLRRVFNLPADNVRERSGRRGRGTRRIATKRMSSRVENKHLVVEFEDGARQTWPLPSRHDKDAIGKVRQEATRFALAEGATDPGQTNAVRKALTDAGYHLTK